MFCGDGSSLQKNEPGLGLDFFRGSSDKYYRKKVGTKVGCIHNKTHGKKIPGQKTPRIKNNKAKLDIKHYSKIGQKTLLKKH